MDSLYALTGDYNALMEYADSIDPEDKQVFLDTVDQLVAAIDFKADEYAAVLSEMGARVNAIDAEIDRLTKRRDSINGNQKRMNDALMEAMKATGREAIHTDLHTFKIVNNGGVLPLVIDGEVPDFFKKVVLENDNKKIREALEGGATLEFAHFGERGKRLSIK